MNQVKIVVFDSSIIYGEPIHHSVEDFISDYKNDKKLKILYKVPEMVLFEAENKMWTQYDRSFGTFVSSAKALIDLPLFEKSKLEFLKSKFKKQKNEIIDFVVKKFDSLGIQILATPTDKIKWGEIINKAAFRELPFEKGDGDKEKGFKDMIIAQTLLVNLPNLLKEGEVIFICNDGKLKEYVKENTKGIKRFRIYPSFLEFKSAIRLSEVTSGKKPIEDISKEAAMAFYNDKDLESSLFIKGKIKEMIIEKYSSVVNPPPREDYGVSFVKPLQSHVAPLGDNNISWIPVSPREYRISKPVFIKKINDLEYLWDSTIVFSQTFESRNYTPWAGNYQYTPNFKITWKSVFSSNGSINTDKSEVIDINYIRHDGWAGVSLSPSLSSGASLSPFLDNLTVEGQGTVYVDSDIAYPIPSPSPEDEAED